jgi:hypothetical protein
MSGGARGFPNDGPYGILYYNGFLFPTPVTIRVDREPVLSEDGRNEKYLRYVIHVEFIYLGRDTHGQPYGTTDVGLDNLKNILTQHRGAFVLANKGSGGIVCNLNAGNSITATNGYIAVSKTDLDSGPKVEVLSWEPVGGSAACRITWRCEIALLAVCGVDGQSDSFKLLDLSYGVRWVVDEEGLITRVTSGHIETSMDAALVVSGKTANLGRNFVYQNLTWLQSMEGLTRHETFELSANKKRLTFNITDQEIPSDNPLYPRTVMMDVEHDTQGSLLGGNNSRFDIGGFRTWPTTLRIEVTLAPGARKDVAYLAMISVFRDRTKNIPLTSSKVELPSGSQVERPDYAIVTRIRISEELMTRKIFFQIEYTVMTSLTKLLATQRFFRKIDEYRKFRNNGEAGDSAVDSENYEEPSWEAYSSVLLSGNDEVGDQRFTVYGNLNGEQRRQNITARDTLFANNHCNRPDTNEGNTPFIGNDIVPIYSDLPSVSTFKPIMSPGKQPASQSWLSYQNQFSLQEQTSAITHTRIQQTAPSTLLSVNDYSANPAQAANVSGWTVENLKTVPNTAQESVIQVRGANKYVINMKGMAMRAGHAIPAPLIRSFGNQLAYRLPGARWYHRQITSSEDNPVYLAMWDVQYALPNAPYADDLQASQDTTGWSGAYI